MRLLLFIILAGYAVRCNDASYYVIEMPEEPLRQYNKPFRVYWNVPTMQCKSKKIPFTDLSKFGIIQNSGDSFRGEKVSILYDPGLFPALLKNETSGKFKFRNGGVPQEGDLEKHVIAFKNTLEQSVPDENFSGIGIIDFESWRPVFRQNFGVLIPYKDISYQIERKLHWFWTERAIQARARQRFEEAGRAFMQTTLSLAKQLRPRGLWGYYGFPYCFNMATNNMVESCSDKVKQENDKTYWLWSESTALYPSIYSSNQLSASQLAMLVRGRAAEAARVARRGTPVLPYFWFRYREGGFLSQTDLDTVLETLYKSNASGFIIWGSSNDVNTVDKCNSLLQYTEEVLGPAIAKYTKASLRNSTDTTTSNPVSNFGLTTWRSILSDHIHNATTSKPTLDPEYHWIPPENYTQDIVHYVDQELKKKPGYNTTDKNTKESVHINYNNNLLIEMILKIFKNDKPVTNKQTEEVIVNISDGDRPQNEDGTNTIVLNIKTNTEHNPESSTPIVPNIITQNPLISLLKDEKKGILDRKHVETDLNLHDDSIIKIDTKITTTASPTRGYFSLTAKYNDGTEYVTHTLIDSQENMATTTELNGVTENDNGILYDLAELGTNVSSVIVDSEQNVTTSTEPNTIAENEDEILAELLTLEPNLSVARTEHSSEVTKLNKFNNTDNITKFNFTFNNYNVTNTSKYYTDVPFDDVTYTLSTNTDINMLLEDNLSSTTSQITDISSSDIPDTTLITLEIAQKSLKDHKKGQVTETTIEKSFTSSTYLGTVTEMLTKETESSSSGYKDFVYDNTEKFSTNTTKTEEHVTLGVNIIDTFYIINSTDAKKVTKGVPLGKYNQSTNMESTTNVEELSRNTTDSTELSKSEVPDVEKEGFRIDGTTEDGETTTNAQEVVVFL